LATGAGGPGSEQADEAETGVGRAAGAADAGDDTSADADVPIYVWNPGATTETFPSVSRDED